MRKLENGPSPFFTPKSTGSDSGLGLSLRYDYRQRELSLSYDIIKAHDGEIKVENREGKAVNLRSYCSYKQTS
jgi:signal transduction histidine kinase